MTANQLQIIAINNSICSFEAIAGTLTAIERNIIAMVWVKLNAEQWRYEYNKANNN